MKKLLASLILLLALTGCGDDVTNINGYTDAEVKAMIDSTLDAQDVVVMTDTVYQQTVDTIYNMVIDTVTHELVDTIYQRVVDTIYNELVDTIYQKVVDTVFTELEKVGIDVSKPRDTTITLSDTVDGIITTKTYKGVVYKGVFYEAHEYGYGAFLKTAPAADIVFYPFGNIDIKENYDWITVYFYDQCGSINKPDYNGFAWRDMNSIKRFLGWRMFNEQDAYEMAQYLNMVVSDTTLVFLSALGYDERGRGTFTASIAKYKVPNTTSKNEDKEKLKYVCAYDLK